MGESSRPKRVRTAGLLWTRKSLLIVVLPLFALAATYVLATIDIRSHDGRVLRSVELGEADVGGMTSEELDIEFDRIDSYIETAPVYINTPDAAYQIEAERLGLKLDRGATRAAVLAAGRDGSAFTRPFTWLGALFSPRSVDAVVLLDAQAAEAGLAAVSQSIGERPGEPALTLQNGRLELEPGSPGNILDVSRLIRDLSASLPSEPGAEITVNAFTTDETMIDVDIQALVDRLNGSSTRPIELVLDERSVVVQPAEFRSWVELNLTGDQPVALLDAEPMYRFINDAAGIAEPEINTRELVVTGSQIRLPNVNAAICCTADTADAVLAAVLAGQTRVDVSLVSDDITPLLELGIGELLGEFTTNHPTGEDRVLNIQRMADIVRGALIAPGDTFSLNGYVGPRTTEGGFVPAGVIYNGVFTEDVGGGVSQFATTLFNSAFFGGLDIVEYQAHSIYIDRYPYGREATVNYPNVDLKLRNPTDTPILIWTEHTPGSITVKLFGTATVIGKQTGQTSQAVDLCTRVRTERTRTWVDGHSEIDMVGATYQPREGYGCDGRPTVPPPECTDDEGLIDTNEDGFGDTCAPIERICPPETQPTDSDGDGEIDVCIAGQCPTDTQPIDLDGDGQIDRCVVPEPTAEPTTEPTAEPTVASN